MEEGLDVDVDVELVEEGVIVAAAFLMADVMAAIALELYERKKEGKGWTRNAGNTS